MAGDWQPKQHKVGTQTAKSKRPGKSRFEITGALAVFDPDFSDKEPRWNIGQIVFDGFGIRKGREIHVVEIVKDTSLETLIEVLRKEKTPGPFTLLWSPAHDGRKTLFTGFKGKKIEIEIDFARFTPGNGVATHFKLILFDVRIQHIGPDYRLIDKKTMKFERINATFGKFEFKSL